MLQRRKSKQSQRNLISFGCQNSLNLIATYVLWFAGAYLSFQDDESGLYMLLMLPGLMAPFLISLAMIFTSKNPSLKKDFINRLTNLRQIQPKILPAFFLTMPLSVLASILLSLPFGGSFSQFQPAEGFSFTSGFIPVLLLLLLAAGFEELGWRRYAFYSLQSRYTYLWHPLFSVYSGHSGTFHFIFVNNSYQYEIFHENIWYGVNFL